MLYPSKRTISTKQNMRFDETTCFCKNVCFEIYKTHVFAKTCVLNIRKHMFLLKHNMCFHQFLRIAKIRTRVFKRLLCCEKHV
jgi:hypothetical protein